MTKSLVLTLALAGQTLLAADSVGDSPTHLLRHPTYSHGKVAFSYLGDIWVVNEDGSGLVRLTDHKAREILPRFSPDGKWIAFSSNREGNYDVFVIPAQGGKPRQLTFHSADDSVVGWSADGRKILFASGRGQGVFPTVTTLFEIPAEGGLEQALPTDWGSWASYSPDGARLAFSRHPGVWSRKHYRGSYAVDLWLMDVKAGSYTRLGDPDYKGNYLWPMFGRNGEIYFVADRLPEEKGVKYAGPEVMKSANNIWKTSENGGALTQVTHHQDGNLFFPSISADGKTIVYEENFGLWRLDTESGKSTEIRLSIQSDVKENEVELRTINSEAESFSLSPSAKRIAVAAHGEIFTVAADRGEVQRVTETPWREESPHWSPDGKRIAFISDRTGREEVWIADERGGHLEQLSKVDCDKSSVVWAPDSKSLLWAGSDRILRRVTIEGGKTEELVSSSIGPVGTPQFSPDGKWISYSKQDQILRSHVYLKPLDGGEEHKVEGEDFLMSSGAKWTADGKKLLLLGGVGAPGMSSLNRTVTQLYSVSLTHLEKNPDERGIDTEEQAQAADGTVRPARGAGGQSSTNRSDTAGDETAPQRRGRGGMTDAATASPKVEVKIEWDGLERRVRKLTSLGGSVTTVAPSPDSRLYAFIGMGGSSEEEGGRGAGGGPALYTISENGLNLTRVAQGTPPDPAEDAPRDRASFGGGFADPQWSKDGRTIFYEQGEGIYSVAAPAVAEGGTGTGGAAPGGRFGGRGGRGGQAAPAAAADSSPTPRRISFSVRLEIDQAAERRQVFEEAWRVMKHRFYDPKMHGVNWAAARETFEPLLSDVADAEELHNVIMEMIGELNASHTGVSGGGTTEAGVQTRQPGFELEPDDTGHLKVRRILKNGPADHDYVKLAVGNYVLGLNGKDLRAGENYWRLFNLLPGRKFEFTVNSKPEAAGAWTVSLEPMTPRAHGDLEYEQWVANHKAMVDKLSQGQIGYLHIRAMDAPSFQKFQRDLLENLDKKALIIDERFNGGGGIDQELLEILNQRVKYQSWRGRGSVEVPRPVQAFFGPMAVLQNERSASNAEMFPDGFRKLGLGKVIGVPTMGAVIGTGSYRLLDGSTIRTPGIRVSTAAGANLENYGVQPDVSVDNTPEDFRAGHDRQIEKAIEVLRGEMK